MPTLPLQPIGTLNSHFVRPAAELGPGSSSPERSLEGLPGGPALGGGKATLTCAPQSYMDPMNEYNALNEAKQMIAVADENQNHHLEPEEVLKYSEFFTGSKLVDYARSVHEEF